jgi:hypothetical protein
VETTDVASTAVEPTAAASPVVETIDVASTADESTVAASIYSS